VASAVGRLDVDLLESNWCIRELPSGRYDPA
jgi:hypothetical protein